VVTTAEVIKRIRLAVGDETATVWDDTADMLPRVNDSRRALWGRLPMAFSIEDIVTELPADIAATTTAIDVADWYIPAIVANAAHALLMEGRREGDAEKAVAQLDLYRLAARGGRAA
jgi:hypothetical protein